MNEINNIKLQLDNHVEVEEFGTIYFPTVEFLKEHNTDAGYNKLIFPFALTLDILDIPDEYKEDVEIFDLFFQGLMFDEELGYFDVLLESLKYYFKSTPEYDGERYCIYVKTQLRNEDITTVLHRKNFDRLAEIILKISKAQRINVEKPPVFENDKQRDIYYKIQEGRRKKNKDNIISFATMINIAMNCGNGYVPPEEINKMTIIQLINRYEAIISNDSWDINFKKYLAGVEPKDLDLTYWVEKVKI